MLDNLSSRGCLLSGVSACKDSHSQIERLVNVVVVVGVVVVVVVVVVVYHVP